MSARINVPGGPVTALAGAVTFPPLAGAVTAYDQRFIMALVQEIADNEHYVK